MRLTLHNVLFWPHLVAGVIAGLVIAIMSFTGVALAFEHQVLDWADRDARTVQRPTPDAPRLPVDELLARVRAAKPQTPPTGVTVYPEPDAAVLVSTGRNAGVYVNPYTGEVREWGAQGWRSFFQLMVEWHRWLAAQGDNRPVGKALTGASNTVFLFLGVSGLYLWWPRKWTWRAVRPALWFRRGLRGKARDWNWHNVIGFWLLPVLIVLTASGMVISYRWASNLVFTALGETPPTAGGPGAPLTASVPPPAPGTSPLPLEALLASAQQRTPAWESVTLRLGGGAPARGPGEGRPPGAREGARPEGARPERPPAGEARKEGPAAVTLALREKDGWPLFASTQVVMDPFTAQELRREAFADMSTASRVRRWLRFLHTGEALGVPGQTVAALGSLGGLFLVWTGFALSWRRFLAWRRARASVASVDRTEPSV
ncbi:PepSY-associated TM helix domain-containing protein [Melittangium boletus]|uniref:PepSY-associated TM helix domain-containing protein n=1 Tax=Melittangium boletus TaxID=83453 RepID=UPI003DA69794